MMVFSDHSFAAICIHQLNRIIEMAFVKTEYFPAAAFWELLHCINLVLEERSFLTVVMPVMNRFET